MPIAVAHESPHRVIDLVSVICETLPGCRISASCDLTKLHEKDDPRHGGGSAGYAPRQRKGGEGRVLPGARSA
ncbi:MAG: hypothetical protein ACLR4A_10830 [Christensenellales bacterium]